MKKKQQDIERKGFTGNFQKIYDWLFTGILCAALVASALLPDSKIARLKLEWLEIGAFVLFFMWLGGFALFGKVEIKKSFLNIPIIAYLVVFLGFYMLSADKAIAEQELRRLILCCGLFFPVMQAFPDNKKIMTVLWVWAASACMAAFYGIFQYFGGFSAKSFFIAWYCVLAIIAIFGMKLEFKKYRFIVLICAILTVIFHLMAWKYKITIIEVPKVDRPFSTFGNPIFFAAYLAITIPVVVSLINITRQQLLKTLLYIIAVVLCVGMFISKTRAAWIALAIGLVLWFVIADYNNGWAVAKKIKANVLKILLIIVAVIALHFAVFAGSSTYKGTVNKIVDLAMGIASRQQAHTLIWRDSFKMWLDNPLFGVGLGSFHIYFPKYASDELKAIWPQGQFIVNDAHNEFLQILTETGIVGFGVIMLLFAMFFLQIKRLWNNESKNSNILLAGFASGTATLLIQNFFSVDMRFVISSAYLFFVMGFTSSFSKETYLYDIRKHVFLRVLIAICVVAAGTVIFKGLQRPYAAYQQLKQEKDFFDEKVLEPAKTLEDLSKLLEKYPNESKIYERLGWVYAKERIWDKAINSYTKASELNPKLVGAFNNLGNIYFQMNNKDKAIEYYKKAVAINPNLLDARLNMGIAYYYKGMLKESATELEEVLKIDPNNYKAISILKRMTE